LIRKATIEDLPGLIPLCLAFARESENIRLDPNAWLNTWTQLISGEIGVIFILDDNHGFIGGLKYPDPNTGELTATEMFWYVDKPRRGKGLTLLKKFEQWAQDQGCKNAIMVHLTDIMPSALKRIYQRKGYREIETHFFKEL
jgi:GNAT superfamily N-acetyltransferase